MSQVVPQVRVNVLDPDFYVDPWEAYRWLQSEAPVFWDPVQRLWVISGYEDIRHVEREVELYSSDKGSRPHIDLSNDRSMISLDGDVHRTQRSLVYKRFTPRGVRTHEQMVRDLVTEILDEVTPLGECEAIEAIASRLPAIMIGDILGYPRELWEKVRFWSEQIMLLAGKTSPEGPPHVTHPDLLPVMQEFIVMTREIIELRKTDPAEGLISFWVNEQGWDDQHVLDETILILDGGAETTRTVIGSMIRELALQPDQRQLLIERPELLDGPAVEEFIRWVSPVLNMSRTVTTDHEFRGQQLKAGDELLLMYPAANRDPRVFEDPDVLDVTRAENPQIAFGSGPHFCLGAHLARLEIQVMFQEMLRRMPDWELVDPDEPQIMPATFARAYDQIRIRFTPSPAS